MLTRNARIFILDEPTATLSDVEIERIFAALRSLRAEGKSIIYITHRLGEVFEICDTVSVLRNGELVGTAQHARDRSRRAHGHDARPQHERNVPAMAGQGRGAHARRRGPACAGRGARLRSRRPPRRRHLHCRPSGLGRDGGPARAGRTCGRRDRPDHRRRQAGSAAVRAGGTQARMQFISEDRAGEGIFLHLDVGKNLVATQLDEHSPVRLLSIRSGLRATARALAAGGRRRSGASALARRGTQRRQSAEAGIRPLDPRRAARRVADERADARRRRRRAGGDLSPDPDILRPRLCRRAGLIRHRGGARHGRCHRHHVSWPAGGHNMPAPRRTCIRSSETLPTPS